MPIVLTRKLHPTSTRAKSVQLQNTSAPYCSTRPEARWLETRRKNILLRYKYAYPGKYAAESNGTNSCYMACGRPNFSLKHLLNTCQPALRRQRPAATTLCFKEKIITQKTEQWTQVSVYHICISYHGCCSCNLCPTENLISWSLTKML